MFFTIEIDSDKISFLDILVIKYDEKIITYIFYKPTDTLKSKNLYYYMYSQWKRNPTRGTHGAFRRSNDYMYASNVIVKNNPFEYISRAQGVLSQYFSEVHCANDHKYHV